MRKRAEGLGRDERGPGNPVATHNQGSLLQNKPWLCLPNSRLSETHAWGTSFSVELSCLPPLQAEIMTIGVILLQQVHQKS